MNVPIILVGPRGEPCGKLRLTALDLVSQAEEKARREDLAKSSALSQTLAEQVEAAGYTVGATDLAEALKVLHRVRSGEPVRELTITVTPSQGGGPRTAFPRASAEAAAYGSSPDQRSTEPMTPTLQPSTPAAGISYFEAERVFPDGAAKVWYERLVGLDSHKERLLVELEMLLFPERLQDWSKKHHSGKVLRLCDLYKNRVPLILLEGDVGTGKTALAETVGDALARRLGGKTRVHLLKLNTQVRGSGLVGEMSDLIAQAFAQAQGRAQALGGEPVLLLIDEADALATSRDTQQMHHEDKAGLNTVLQRLDNLRLTQLPIAALFITNRPEALDPAVRRRAALDLRFERPDDRVRAEIIKSSVPELSLSNGQIDELVRLTGAGDPKNSGTGFTASDLTDRLLPSALRAAYTANRPLGAEDLTEQARLIEATPPFGGTNGQA
jgi:AAA+ superfamily predicted ATPase